MIDINELAAKTLENAKIRQANGAKINYATYPMLKHCATEVVEATESYCYFANEIPKDYEDFEMNINDMKEKHRSHFASELADIICCVLIIAANENIDIEKAVLDCIEKNKKRAEGVGDKK